MECETLGLKWTCSRLCPSRSGNGVVGHRVSKCKCDGLLAIVDYQGWSRTPRIDTA